MLPIQDLIGNSNIMLEIAKIIGGKWKLVILDVLVSSEALRFNELRRRVPGITQSTLTSQLRELEKDNLVTREVFAEVPVRVEYSASDRAIKLKKVFVALNKWFESDINAKT